MITPEEKLEEIYLEMLEEHKDEFKDELAKSCIRVIKNIPLFVDELIQATADSIRQEGGDAQQT